MPDGLAKEPIPADTALRLCEAIAASNRAKWWTYTGIWCRFCIHFSATPSARCWANAEGNRGCSQVNGRFDASTGSRT